ncbi:MAG: 2OG-Fe(II) oxygenase [Thiobacillaceae bacterium]|jgi:hypothetical protein
MSDITEATIAKTFLTSLHHAGQHHHPYQHWLIDHCLPEDMVDELISLPFKPAHIEDTKGRRETHNDKRIHFGEEYRTQFKVMDALARVFQSQQVVDELKAVTGAPLAGTSLRIEYCQDTDGFWLEPHTDIGVKKFTMLLYLNREPEGADWGTDMYLDKDTHVGRAPSGFNTGLIFVPSDRTWHGFEKRPMKGVRKSLIINYVGQEWRNRHELCFADDAIG